MSRTYPSSSWFSSTPFAELEDPEQSTLPSVTVRQRSPQESNLHHGPPTDANASYFRLPSVASLPFLGSSSTKLSRSPQVGPTNPGSSTVSPVDGYSAHPSPTPQYFLNPWPSWRSLTWTDAYTAYYTGALLKNAPKPGEIEDAKVHGRLVRVLRPDFRLTQQQAVGPERVCWLGHASVLVQIPWERPRDARLSSDDGMCGVVFDPIFSQRCSPTQWVGPSRHLPPPCALEDLPPIHVVCISHDHCKSLSSTILSILRPLLTIIARSRTDDHLDYDTIMALWEINKQRIHFFVPLGVKAWFLACGIPSQIVTELDWHQSATIRIPSSASSVYRDDISPSSLLSSTASLPETSFSLDQSRMSSTANLLRPDGMRFEPSVRDSCREVSLSVTCTPAQHRSGRGVCDQMRTLWCSWIVATLGRATSGTRGNKLEADADDFKVFFAGDTGYRYAGAPEADLEQAICPAFREIAARYGPVTLSLLPISTGSSLSFLRTVLGISLNHYSLTSPQHSNAWDAIQISKIMGSKASLAIHHSTFSHEDESRGCVFEFDKTRSEEDVPAEWGEEGCFVVSNIGEVLTIGVPSEAPVPDDFYGDNNE